MCHDSPVRRAALVRAVLVRDVLPIAARAFAVLFAVVLAGATLDALVVAALAPDRVDPAAHFAGALALATPPAAVVACAFAAGVCARQRAVAGRRG